MVGYEAIRRRAKFSSLAQKPVQLMLFVVFAFGVFSTFTHSDAAGSHSSDECQVCQLPASSDGDDADLDQIASNITWVTQILAFGKDTATEQLKRHSVVARGPPSSL